MKIVFNKNISLCLDGTNIVPLEKGIEYEVPEHIAKNILSGVYGYNIGYISKEIHQTKKTKQIEQRQEEKQEIVVKETEEIMNEIIEKKEKNEEEVIQEKAIDNAPKNKAIMNAPKNKKNRKK